LTLNISVTVQDRDIFTIKDEQELISVYRMEPFQMTDPPTEILRSRHYSMSYNSKTVKIKLYLQWQTNMKSYNIYQSVLFLITLNDLEWLAKFLVNIKASGAYAQSIKYGISNISMWGQLTKISNKVIYFISVLYIYLFLFIIKSLFWANMKKKRVNVKKLHTWLITAQMSDTEKLIANVQNRSLQHNKL